MHTQHRQCNTRCCAVAGWHLPWRCMRWPVVWRCSPGRWWVLAHTGGGPALPVAFGWCAVRWRGGSGARHRAVRWSGMARTGRWSRPKALHCARPVPLCKYLLIYSGACGCVCSLTRAARCGSGWSGAASQSSVAICAVRYIRAFGLAALTPATSRRTATRRRDHF